jgi:hypothetical protein
MLESRDKSSRVPTSRRPSRLAGPCWPRWPPPTRVEPLSRRLYRAARSSCLARDRIRDASVVGSMSTSLVARQPPHTSASTPTVAAQHRREGPVHRSPRSALAAARIDAWSRCDRHLLGGAGLVFVGSWSCGRRHWGEGRLRRRVRRRFASPRSLSVLATSSCRLSPLYQPRRW